MKIAQATLALSSDPELSLQELQELRPQLVLVFGALPFFERGGLARTLPALFPGAACIGCSTAGEIAGRRVHDQTCVVTAVRFADTPLAVHSTALSGMADSHAAGMRLGRALRAPDLRAVLVFGPGVAINGSALVNGLRTSLPSGVAISGGLAADAGAFVRTWTLCPHGVTDHRVVAVGFYGARIRATYGSYAGWETFGPQRTITRCSGNVLYELDGKRALDIYQAYLGDYARDLPASGLLFPFEMLDAQGRGTGVFRTIIGIDALEGSLTLAGDVVRGGALKLMHAGPDMLTAGAQSAAHMLRAGGDSGGLAILLSCVGRKLVMGDRVDDEVEAVCAGLHADTMLAGYYSNGEIAPAGILGDCSLNNQTMTITWLQEE